MRDSVVNRFRACVLSWGLHSGGRRDTKTTTQMNKIITSYKWFKGNKVCGRKESVWGRKSNQRKYGSSMKDRGQVVLRAWPRRRHLGSSPSSENRGDNFSMLSNLACISFILLLYKFHKLGGLKFKTQIDYIVVLKVRSLLVSLG